MSAQYNENVILSATGKRRKGNKTEWKKTKKSKAVNSSRGKKPNLSCAHDTKLCNAQTLSKGDIEGKF